MLEHPQHPCAILLPLLSMLEQQLIGPTIVFYYGGQYNRDIMDCVLTAVAKQKPVIVLKVPDLKGHQDFYNKEPQDERILPYRFEIGKLTTEKRFTASSTVLFVEVKMFANLRMALPLWDIKSNVLAVPYTWSEFYTILLVLHAKYRCTNMSLMFPVKDAKVYFLTFENDERGEMAVVEKYLPESIFPKIPYARPELTVFKDIAMPLTFSEWIGVEQKLLTEICQHLKIRLIDYTEDFKQGQISQDEAAKMVSYQSNAFNKADNITPSFLLLHLSHGQVITGNVIYPWSTGIYLELGTPYMETSLVWYVPSPKPNPALRAYAVVQVFSYTVWTVFSVVLLGILLIMSIDITRHKKTKTIAMLETIALVVNQPIITNISNIRVFSTFIFTVYFFTLHTSTAYQAVLINSFSTVPRDAGYKNMKDLQSSNLTLIINDGHETLLESLEDNLEIQALKGKNMKYSPVINPEIVADGKHALLGSKIFNDYVLQYGQLKANSLYDEFDQPKISVIPTPVTTYLISLYYSPWCPYTKQMNEITQYLVEGGLPDLWLRQFYRNRRDVLKWNRQLVNKPYSINDVGFVFGIFILGIPVCLLVFLYEYASYLIPMHNVKSRLITSLTRWINSELYSLDTMP